MIGSFWSSFVAIFQKEFLHIRRDRATMVSALAIPIFQLVLFGFIDQTVRNVPTVVVDQDHTQYSRELMDQLRATKTFIVIPPDYHDTRARGLASKVLVLIDGSDSNVSAQALASVNGIASQTSLVTLQKLAPNADQPISVQPIILFNPEGRTANYIIPGLIAIMLQIVAIALTAIAIVREREKGTLEQLLVTPVNPIGLMLGKLAPYLVVGVMETGIVLFAMRFGFDVPIRGSLVFLFFVAVIYLFALLAMGLLVSSRAQSQAQAMQQAQMFFLPSIFLSGYIFPVAGLPLPLYLIGRVLPATHMVEIMRGIVLRDAGFAQLWPNVLALVILSTLLMTLSVRRFQKVAL
jgi:ABC-2 type transport system permease protein